MDRFFLKKKKRRKKRKKKNHETKLNMFFTSLIVNANKNKNRYGMWSSGDGVRVGVSMLTKPVSVVRWGPRP
jgi:hypothetical protein